MSECCNERIVVVAVVLIAIVSGITLLGTSRSYNLISRVGLAEDGESLGSSSTAAVADVVDITLCVVGSVYSVGLDELERTKYNTTQVYLFLFVWERLRFVWRSLFILLIYGGKQWSGFWRRLPK